MYLRLPQIQNIAPGSNGRHTPDTCGRSNAAMPIDGTPIVHNLPETPLALLAGRLTLALTALAIYLPYDVLAYARIATLFPSLLGV